VTLYPQQCDPNRLPIPGSIYSWSVVPGSGGIITSTIDSGIVVCDSGCYVLTVTHPNPIFSNCEARDTVCVHGASDVTPPVVTCPPNITVKCHDDVALYPCPTTLAEFESIGGSATDMSGPLQFNCYDSPLVNGVCGGTITRTFVVTDACDNADSCQITITINDDIPPLISVPPGSDLGCNGSVPAPDTSIVTASDNCHYVEKYWLSDTTSGDCYKTLVRTYQAKDTCNNTANATQTFTWKDDVTPPVITCNGNGGYIGCNPTQAQKDAAFGTCTAVDNCDGPITPTVSYSTPAQNGWLRTPATTRPPAR